MTIGAIILIILGVLFCPIFTLGCVLIHFNQDVLGYVVIAISIISGFIDKDN